MWRVVSRCGGRERSVWSASKAEQAWRWESQSIAVPHYRREPRLGRQSNLALWVVEQFLEGGDGELWGEVGVEVGELAPAYVIVSGVVKGGVRSLNGGELIAKAGEGGGGGGKGADVGIAEGHKAEGRQR